MNNQIGRYSANRYGLLLTVLVHFSISICQAEPKTNDSSAIIRKAQGIIRELSQQKAGLEAEKSAWLGEKSTLDAKVEQLQEVVKKLLPLQIELERYKAGLESVKTNLESQLDQQHQREQALLEKFNALVSKARDIRDDNTLLVEAVKEREQWISQCTVLNQQLRSVNLEILNEYQQKGILQQLAELEPLTGIAQVQAAGVVEDYRYKLQQLKITPFETATGVTEVNKTADKQQEDAQVFNEPSNQSGSSELNP